MNDYLTSDLEPSCKWFIDLEPGYTPQHFDLCVKMSSRPRTVVCLQEYHAPKKLKGKDYDHS